MSDNQEDEPLRLTNPGHWPSIITNVITPQEKKSLGLSSWSELPEEVRAATLGSKEALNHICGDVHAVHGGIYTKEGELRGINAEFAAPYNIPGPCSTCKKKQCEKRAYLITPKGEFAEEEVFTQKVIGFGPIQLRPEPGSAYPAVYGSLNEEIAKKSYALTTSEGPVKVRDLESGEMKTLNIRQYGTLGLPNTFDPSSQNDVSKALYRVHTNSQPLAQGHKYILLENGNKMMTLTLITGLVFVGLQAMLTEAHIKNPTKCNGGEVMRDQLKRVLKEHFNKIKKEANSKLKKQEFKSKDEMQIWLNDAETELTLNGLREDLKQAFTIEGSMIFKPVVRFMQQKTKDPESGEYVPDPSRNDKGGPFYMTFKRSLFAPVYNNPGSKKGKEAAFPSENITGIHPSTLEMARVSGKEFQHLPLVAAHNPSEEHKCETRDSLKSGAWLNGLTILKYIKTPTGPEARGKLVLKSLQLLQNGQEETSKAQQEAVLLRPISFGKPMITAPPRQAEPSSPPSLPAPVIDVAPKRDRPNTATPPSSSPPKRRRVVQSAEADEALTDDENEENIDPTQVVREEDVASPESPVD